MEIFEILKAVLFGVVEGITEWLPISSTGHMILLDEVVKLQVSASFMEMFLVVIQLGAIMAVVLLYWKKLLPISLKEKPMIKRNTLSLWGKIIVACIPAAIIGFLFEDILYRYFYNFQTVAIALIVFGILFIVIENYNKKRIPVVTEIDHLSYKTTFLIGLFQVIAAIFPGTSRSGATILGGILLGTSRTVAAEFTFFLAVPVMLGASLLKLSKFGLTFTGFELSILWVGLVVSFVVSVIAIKFLMSYIKKHDFKIFGWYRIVLGIIVLIFFLFLR
ncbi:MAG: undecaprenyl-diphosphate phosphatase [Bacillota bacterium]